MHFGGKFISFKLFLALIYAWNWYVCDKFFSSLRKLFTNIFFFYFFCYVKVQHFYFPLSYDYFTKLHNDMYAIFNFNSKRSHHLSPRHSRKTSNSFQIRPAMNPKLRNVRKELFYIFFFAHTNLKFCFLFLSLSPLFCGKLRAFLMPRMCATEKTCRSKRTVDMRWSLCTLFLGLP